MSGPRFGLLAYPGIDNLGDVIQSLAARRFLPRVDVLIERERISAPPVAGPVPVKMILNGWFMHDVRFWPPHPAIEPLPVSMHFAEPGVSHLRRWARSPLERMLSGAGADYLRRWGPVGARDHFTLEQLEKRGIQAYHSGCLSLTLRGPAVPRGEAIIACDLTQAALGHLRRSTSRPLIEATHLGGGVLDHAGQQTAANRLLTAYNSAAAVVTTRIHAALPCLALGTPVLLVHSARPPRRVSDPAALMHSCSERAFLANRYDFDLAAPPSNPEGFRPLARALEATCGRFTGFDQSSGAVGANAHESSG